MPDRTPMNSIRDAKRRHCSSTARTIGTHSTNAMGTPLPPPPARLGAATRTATGPLSEGLVARDEAAQELPSTALADDVGIQSRPEDEIPGTSAV